MNELINRMLSVSYKYAASLIVSLGAILVLLSKDMTVFEGYSEIIYQIGFSLIPAGIVALIFETSIRRSFSEKISQDIRNSVISAISTSEGVTNAGVINIENGLSDDKLKSAIRGASKELWVLQTWVANKSTIQNELIFAAKRGCKVKILMLKPGSPMAKARSNDLLMDNEDYVSNEISVTLTHLRALWVKNGKPRDLQVRLYHSTPSLFVYRADNVIFVGTFLIEKEGITGPTLEIEVGNGYFSSVIQQHFDGIWDRHSSNYLLESDKANKSLNPTA